jgi:hypothetical protein
VGKIIFWLVVFFVGLLVLRLVNIAQMRQRDPPPRKRPGRDTATIRCVNCGVYLPKAEAIEGPRGPVCGDPQCLPRETKSRR